VARRGRGRVAGLERGLECVPAEGSASLGVVELLEERRDAVEQNVVLPARRRWMTWS
jgi:hypothetical protein